MIEIIRCVREEPRAWWWMPSILYRAGKFCETMQTETLPQEMIEMIRLWFVMGDYRLGLWIAVKDQCELVGHLLATVEPIDVQYPRYVLIRQVEINRGIDLRQVTKEGFKDVEKWTRSFGLSKIVMVTHRSTRAMARRWGFKEHKVLMHFMLNKEGG